MNINFLEKQFPIPYNFRREVSNKMDGIEELYLIIAQTNSRKYRKKRKNTHKIEMKTIQKMKIIANKFYSEYKYIFRVQK